MASDVFPGLDGVMELPQVLRRKIPLVVRLYGLFHERSNISIRELKETLGASDVGIKLAISQLVAMGLLRREWTGKDRGAPMSYFLVDPADATLEATG